MPKSARGRWTVALVIAVVPCAVAQQPDVCSRPAITPSLEEASRSPPTVCVLSLNKIRLSTLPDSISRLTNLRVLIPNKNDLDSLPAAIESLHHLTRVYIGGSPRMHFDQLLEHLAQLPELRGLGIDDNQIAGVPANIGRLSRLESLGLSGDSLRTLPAQLSSLTHLKILDLYNNQFEEPPEALRHLPNLQTLFLRSNSIDSLGLSRIREWLPSTRINLDVPPELYLMPPYRHQ